MRKKPSLARTLFFTLLLLLISTQLRTFPCLIPEVKAHPNEVTNVDTGLTYSSIQEAIDATETLNGHKISISPGIYYDQVRIDKSLTLIGSNPKTTIIDGRGTGTVVRVQADNVCVENFTIRNSGSNPMLDCGILLDYCFGSRIDNNNVVSCLYGIYVFHSPNSTLTCNNISENYEDGLWVYYSGNSTLVKNRISDNRYNFGLFGGSFSHFDNNITPSNTVDGKPIRYLVDVNDVVIQREMDIGVLYMINSGNVTVKDLAFTRNGHGLFAWNLTNSLIENITASENNYGIYLQSSAQNVIARNNCPNNWVGICLQDSDRNVVVNNLTPNNEKGISLYKADRNILTGNTISTNLYGIRLFASDFNEAWHNNLIENTEQANLVNSHGNAWDNGFEGNFWSNYNGSDLNMEGLGGIVYIIDSSNQDCRPLLGTFFDFTARYREHDYNISVVSNWALSNFTFEPESRAIRFSVKNDVESDGFCRMRIPHALMNPNQISVRIDNGLTDLLHYNNSLFDDGEHRWIYFACQTSPSEITVIQLRSPLIWWPLFLSLVVLTACVTAFLVWKRRNSQSPASRAAKE